MKYKIIFILMLILGITFPLLSQDDPSGYTNNYGLRMWNEGAHPGADSINQNLIDLDLHIKNRDKRIDSLKSAFSWMFNFPSGTWKRYNSAEFDDDTLKVKSGVFPKLSLANTFTQAQTLSATQTNFGTTTHTLNFNIDNDAGGIFIKKNNTTNLLKWDEGDGLWWQFLYPVTVAGDVDITGSFKVNGVPLSTGGGDAYLGNRQTFTKRNTFDSLNVTKIVSDLPFYKGANTWIKTGDNFPLFLGANGDTAILISSLTNDVRFYESITVDNDGTFSGDITGYTVNSSNDMVVGNDLSVINDVNVDGTTYTSDLNTTNITSVNITTDKVNKVTITQPATSATLTIANSKAATFNNDFTTGSHATTFTTTGTTNVTLPTTGTLSTLAGSETLTNKSIDASTNTLTHIGRSDFQFSTNVISGIPVDSTIYYLGGQITPDGTANFHKIFVPTACTIKAVSVAVLKGTAASSENAAVYVLANGTTATAISTTWQWTTANNYDMVSNTGLNISLAAGEYFNIKIITPNWGTNPGSGTCSFQVTVEILNSN